MKNPTFPLVSICIPIYNGEAFLAEALASVKTQTYPNLEVVVSDDRSSDASLAIVEQFQQEVDLPVRIFSHEPQGIGANWNHCVAKAQGTYIKFLFQDDVLLPTCVEQMVEAFQQFPEVALVACKRDFMIDASLDNALTAKWLQTYGDLQAELSGDYAKINSTTTYLNKAMFGSATFMKSPLNKIGEPTTIMFRKQSFETIGGFDTHLEQILDYVFCYRILKESAVVILHDKLVKFRIHGNQATHQNRSKKIKDAEYYPQILYREFLPLLAPALQKKLKNKYSKIQKIKNYLQKKLHLCL